MEIGQRVKLINFKDNRYPDGLTGTIKKFTGKTLTTITLDKPYKGDFVINVRNDRVQLIGNEFGAPFGLGAFNV